MSAPVVKKGESTVKVPWDGTDYEVSFYDPTAKHWAIAERRVAMEGVPRNEDTLVAALIEVIISRVGERVLDTEKAQKLYWSEAPIGFKFRVTSAVNAIILREIVKAKN